MALHGSSFPDDHGGFVVTVHCPNAFAHQRLMQAINGIVPEAGESVSVPATTDDSSRTYTAYMAGFEPNEDGVIVKGGCATGSCELE